MDTEAGLQGSLDGLHGALCLRDCNLGSLGTFWKAAPLSHPTIPPVTLLLAQALRPLLLGYIINTLNSGLHAALDPSCWHGPSLWQTAAEEARAQGSERQMQAGTQACAWKALWSVLSPQSRAFD